MKPWRKIYRNIFENEDLGTLPGDAFQLFAALIIYADDEGRMKAGPAYLRGKAFRYRDDVKTDDVRIWRNALADRGFVQLYAAEGEDYLALPNWFKWQGKRSDRFEPSEIPVPPKKQDFPNDRQPVGNPVATKRQPHGNQLATGWQPVGNPEEIREEKRRGEGEVRLPYDNDNHIVSDTEKDKGNSDAAAHAPLFEKAGTEPTAAPSLPASPRVTETEPSGSDKANTTKKGPLPEGQYPEADILAVAAHYCELQGMAFVSETTKTVYLKQTKMFYAAKDLLALNGGDVDLAKLCITHLADHYENRESPLADWNWSHVLVDWQKWNQGIQDQLQAQEAK